MRTISGFKSVQIIYRKENLGLAKSICEGINAVFNEFESIIVLEDDLITAPYFLQYMKDGLNKYKNNQEVISIQGYTYPIGENLPETFFRRAAGCWGWATWRRGWALFEENGQVLLDGLKKHGLIKEFNLNNSYQYSRMLEEQIKGYNNSWAIRWHASAFLANKLSLYPGKSMVNNNGFHNGGTHCQRTKIYDVEVNKSRVYIGDVPVVHSIEIEKKIGIFFKKSTHPLVGIVKRYFPIFLINNLRHLRNYFNKNINE